MYVRRSYPDQLPNGTSEEQERNPQMKEVFAAFGQMLYRKIYGVATEREMKLMGSNLARRRTIVVLLETSATLLTLL